MKRRAHLQSAVLTIVAFLVCAATVSAWSDSMPHYGNGGCGGHMTNGTHVGTGYTFYICKAASQATYWTAFLTNRTNGVKLSNCGITNQPVPSSGVASFNCTGIPSGFYTATISYTVPGNSFAHVDSYYIAP